MTDDASTASKSVIVPVRSEQLAENRAFPLPDMTSLPSCDEQSRHSAESSMGTNNYPHGDAGTGPEEGEHSGLDVRHEPGREPRIGTGDRDSESRSHADSDDLVVNFEEIFHKWQDQIRYGKRPRTVKQYRSHIRRLASTVRLEEYTLRQLKGRKSTFVIVEYLKTISRDQWRYAISALRNFWKIGLRIDWPDADIKAFTGTLPPTGRHFVPREHVMVPWYSAIEKEPDVYRKLIVLLIADFGYRPDHLYKLQMKDVQTDENGNPDAIVVDGAERKFKTNAWVASYLPLYVRDVLKQFNVKVGKRDPDGPLIPYRHSHGRIEPSRPLNARVFYREWHRFEKTWTLPELNPNAFRHFVCRTCESVGLSKSASGYLVGHGTRHGETYRDWYSNLDVEEALEEQQMKLPTGIMGLLTAPKIDLTEKIPSQLLSLCSEFIAGKIGDLEFATKAGSIRTQMVAEEARHIEP